jgi:DinB superfamily
VSDNDAIVREQLVQRLRGRGAHMPFEEAIQDFPMEQINAKFPNGTYGTWALVEHLRRTQADMLDYVTNPNYEHHEWPKDYWPDENEVASAEDWTSSVNGFFSDLERFIGIVENGATDLYAPIEWAQQHNIMRCVLIICDHNAYHIGELAIMRQAMGTW